MQINRKMTISDEKLFDTLTQSVLFDIEKHTGKVVEIDDLPQFEYIKTFDKTGSAGIKIEKYEKNVSYHYSTKTTKNHFFVTYDIFYLSPDSCQLKYSEEIVSHGHMQKLNDALVGTLLNRFKKKRFIQMLKNIEES